MFSLQRILPIYFFVIAIGVLQTYAQDSPEVNKLETFYYNKCRKNSGTTAAFEKLRNKVYEMYKFLELSFQDLPRKKGTFCNSHRPHLLHRIKEVSKDLKPCLAKEEKYFADLIETSFTEFLHFLCYNKGEYTTIYFSDEGKQCIQIIEKSSNNGLETCMNQIFPLHKNFITRQEFCHDVTVAKKCFSQLLEVYCPTSYDLRRLNVEFFKFIGKPCNSSGTGGTKAPAPPTPPTTPAGAAVAAAGAVAAAVAAAAAAAAFI